MAGYSDKEVVHSFKDNSSFVESCRCDIDPRERHVVRKLDRYQLEDRYLRLLEEVNSLKKLSNSQEDKIKRLATKLMRFGANPRSCLAVELTHDQDKFSLLEAENCKLKDKICVLRNQLVNYKIFGRSPSRGRRQQQGSNASPVTGRSENSRLKVSACQCINAQSQTGNNDVHNYSLKIQELEAEKKEMMSRVAELEIELSNFTSGNRREKVAENVEYIRVWRQMKQQNERLVAAQSANEILNDQIYQLKNLLEESSKNNKKASAELEAERKQVARLSENVSKVKDSEIDLKEREERITDLTSELKILQQHNLELLELSSKFGRVEQENIELKRKVTEQLTEQQLFKDTLNNEKTEVTALKAAKDELLKKIHELQKEIDVLKIQLMAQSDSLNKVAATLSKKSSNQSKRTSSVEESSKRGIASEEIRNIDAAKGKAKDKLEERGGDKKVKPQLMEKAIQTETLPDSAKKLRDSNYCENCSKNKGKIQLSSNGNSTLSREGMLKLLEQVQINTPLETQNATRLRHVETAASSSAAPVRVQRQVSNLESLLFGDSGF